MKDYGGGGGKEEEEAAAGIEAPAMEVLGRRRWAITA